MAFKQPRHQKAGQALVETALLITLLFLLLSAAVDVALAYFAYQAASNAAQEGVTYGSNYPSIEGDLTKNNLADGAIRLRVRNEQGATTLPRRVTVVNMQDLNSDGTADDPITQGENNPNGYIIIKFAPNQMGQLYRPDLPVNPDTYTSNSCNVLRLKNYCDIIVTVKFDYKPFFFLAPIFGASQVSISATRTMTVVGGK